MQAEISIHALREEGDHRGRADAALLRSISIHALREEGDGVCSGIGSWLDISIHALREEGDRRARSSTVTLMHFYPRPPRGGRPRKGIRFCGLILFLSTPSARRATFPRLVNISAIVISIHALREEGDGKRPRCSSSTHNFYPRPPRGGRRRTRPNHAPKPSFLSTPSARRATCSVRMMCRIEEFLSTPSARRATQ